MAIFPNIWSRSIFLELTHPNFAWVHELGLLVVNNSTQPSLSSTPHLLPDTHQQLSWHHSFMSSAEDKRKWQIMFRFLLGDVSWFQEPLLLHLTWQLGHSSVRLPCGFSSAYLSHLYLPDAVWILFSLSSYILRSSLNSASTSLSHRKSSACLVILSLLPPGLKTPPLSSSGCSIAGLSSS